MTSVAHFMFTCLHRSFVEWLYYTRRQIYYKDAVCSCLLRLRSRSLGSCLHVWHDWAAAKRASSAKAACATAHWTRRTARTWLRDWHECAVTGPRAEVFW